METFIMNWIRLVGCQVLLLFECCHGFLLDGLTTTRIPHNDGTMTNGQYIEVLNLLRKETQSRVQLESLVNQLQQEIFMAKQDASAFDQSVARINRTLENQLSRLEDDTILLQNSHQRLKGDNSLLKHQYDLLEQNNTLTRDKTRLLEQEVELLSQKIIIDSRKITNTQNKAKCLETDTTAAKHKLVSISKSLNLTIENNRSLGIKFDRLEEIFENITFVLERGGQNITFHNQIKDHLETDYREFENRSEILENRQNMTALKLHQALDTLSGRAAVKACIKTYAATFTGVIPFTGIKTTHGLNNIDSIKRDGIFTCEKTGLYLITVYVMTNNHAGNIQIEKNNDVIAYGFFSIGAHYTTGSATVISHLDVDDKISVTSYHIHVYGYYQSCLDVLQIQ